MIYPPHHIKHTQQRYFERFNEILSDDDYNEICSLLIISNDDTLRLTKNKYKKIIIFKEKYMWCVFNRRLFVITIYPLNRKEIINYKNNTIDYIKIQSSNKKKYLRMNI